MGSSEFDHPDFGWMDTCGSGTEHSIPVRGQNPLGRRSGDDIHHIPDVLRRNCYGKY